MTDPDETLSAIDAAIDGWTGYDATVSPDAMRWTPRPTDRTTGAPVYIAPAGTPPDFSRGEWTQIGWTTEDGLASEIESGEDTRLWGRSTLPTTREMSVALTPEQVEAFRHFAEQVKRHHEVMRRSAQRATKGLLKVFARVHAATAPVMFGDDYRRHRRNCRACNPAGNPKPLKVNGADYARRRKNRRRRGR